MPTLDDVRALATALPEVEEGSGHDGVRSWKVRGKSFVWERPLRRADLVALGPEAPTGTVVGAYVRDLGVKEALLAEDGPVVFTTPHFDGYPAVLVRLDDVAPDALRELVTDAWVARAPKRLARELPAT